VRRRENTPSLRKHAAALPLLAGLAGLAGVACPALARGQGLPGIDLSEPPPREHEKPRPPPATATPTAPRDAGGLGPVGAPGERDAALLDRVKAVQRKGFLKRDRIELTVSPLATLNDAFYQKVGVGGRLAWNIQDSFAVAARGAYWWTVRSDHLRQGQTAFQAQLLSSQPYAQLALDALWSPIYGKASWLGSRIVHFDVYLLGGLGAVWSDTSIAPRSEGPHPAADLGAGLRFYPADWLALELACTGTFYPDRPNRTPPRTPTPVVAARPGGAIVWPLSFEYAAP
jgi:outer membrane beta-barrel protein